MPMRAGFAPDRDPTKGAGAGRADRPAARSSRNILMLNAADAAGLGVGEPRGGPVQTPLGRAPHPEKSLLSRLSPGHFSRYSRATDASRPAVPAARHSRSRAGLHAN